MKNLLSLFAAALAAFFVSPGAHAQGSFKTLLVTQTVTLPTGSTIINNGWNQASGEWKFTGNVTLLGVTNTLNGSILPSADTGAVLGSNTKRYTQLRLSDGLYLGGSSGGAAAASISPNGTQPNQGVFIVASGTGVHLVSGPISFSNTITLPSSATISNSSGTTVASGAWSFPGSFATASFSATSLTATTTLTLPTGSTITNNGWNEASGTWKFTGNVTLLGSTNVLNGSVLPSADTGAVLGSNTLRYTQLRLSDGVYVGGSGGGASAVAYSFQGSAGNQGAAIYATGSGVHLITGPLSLSGTVYPVSTSWAPTTNNAGTSASPFNQIFYSHDCMVGAGGSSPTIVLGGAAGSGATGSIAGTDTGGVLTLNTGTGTTGGNQIGVVAAHNWDSVPRSCILTPANAAAEVVMATPGGPFVDSAAGVTTSQMVVSCATALAASTTYKFWYRISQ